MISMLLNSSRKKELFYKNYFVISILRFLEQEDLLSALKPNKYLNLSKIITKGNFKTIKN